MSAETDQKNRFERELVFAVHRGTTAIACVQMGRRFIGIEQDPEYFKSAVERIRAATAQGDMFFGQNQLLGPLAECHNEQQHST